MKKPPSSSEPLFEAVLMGAMPPSNLDEEVFVSAIWIALGMANAPGAFDESVPPVAPALPVMVGVNTRLDASGKGFKRADRSSSVGSA